MHIIGGVPSHGCARLRGSISGPTPLRTCEQLADRHVLRALMWVKEESTSIVAGKAGFQKTDVMDYGSLYGMGSYFGEG